MKNVLVISTTPRIKGNSDILADECIRGIKEAGNKVEKINLSNQHIHFCRGCLSCQQTHKCIIQDDMEAILMKMLQADVIVFATPVYFYGMCAQMKTLLDRTNPLYSMPYAFKDIYLLACAAEEDQSAVSGTITGLKGWVDCFENARLIKTVFAGGVEKAGDIITHPALSEAYELGKTIY